MNVAHDRRFGWNIKLNKARELEPWVVTKVSSAGSVLNINRDGKLDVNGKKKQFVTRCHRLTLPVVSRGLGDHFLCSISRSVLSRPSHPPHNIWAKDWDLMGSDR